MRTRGPSPSLDADYADLVPVDCISLLPQPRSKELPASYQ